MKVLGEPAQLLGVQIKRDRKAGTVTIDQTKYISNILKRFGMQESHGTTTPISVGVKLDKPQRPATTQEKVELDKIPYKQAVGSLIFLACLTHPDLAYAIHLVSQFMADYRRDHWIQVRRIMRYIKHTKDYRITYRRGDGLLRLEGFSDSDWGADPIDRKSLGSYIFLLAGGPFS